MKEKTVFGSFKSGQRSFFAFLFLLVAGLFLAVKLIDHSRTTTELSYSAFMHKVEENAVKEVIIKGSRVYGVLHDGTSAFEATVPEQSTSLLEALKAHNVEVYLGEAETAFSWWFWLLLPMFVLGVLLILFFMRQAKTMGATGPFAITKSRARLFLPTQIKTTFADVAGADEAKQELMDIVEFLKRPEKIRALGAKLPRGILLVGDPGNGKTLLAKAIAGEAHCAFFSVSGPEFFELYAGVGAARMRDLFAQARRHAPCILFIDEIDALGRQRGLGGNAEEREQTLNQFLTELDGFESQDAPPVIVIGATNIPEVLDKALLRPGRFDRRITVPYPDRAAREQIIAINAREVRLSDAVDREALAESTAGFSGADLANLINQAALVASKKGHRVITPEDIEEARKKTQRTQETRSMSSGGKTKLFMPSQVKTRFSDVAGVYEAKEELQDIIDYLRDPERFKRLGARVPRGVLLQGAPGNGKTLLARAVAGEAGRPFFVASGSEFVEMYVGVGAARVRELFEQARKHAPAIIFIDEIDAFGSRRRDAGSGGAQEHSQTINQLLTEMDGFDAAAADVIVIGATNRVDVLDKALLRPGRFDRIVDVPYPDLKARAEILQVHMKHVVAEPSIDVSKIARGTAGFSAADLAGLINEAALCAAKRGATAVEIVDLEEARDKIILGKASRSKIMSPRELEITAYHEAGHALVRLMLPEVSEPLYKVTIVPRGMSLGSTHWLPERDKYMTSREEMLASIMSALGGRIAEEIVFNVVSTGASSDFKAATDIARDMVCAYGMSRSLGPVIYEHSSYTGNPEYSEETARRIDEEIRAILESCYTEAKELIVRHRDKLTMLAKTLLEKETVSAEEVYEILQLAPRVSHSLR